MLGKLMKYEFKATARIFLPMFAALLVVSLVSRIFITLRVETPMAIGIALSVIMIIAVCVITLIITLQRFYKNLLTNEGYLMFTLPVKTDSIIWSKMIVATIWSILSLIIRQVHLVEDNMCGLTESHSTTHLLQLISPESE